MNKNLFLLGLLSCGLATNAVAQDNCCKEKKADKTECPKKCDEKKTQAPSALSRFTIGGYGEAVMSRNFYSQHFNRYKTPELYKDDKSHGRFDLPHVTLNLGYDFGHGWTMGMEIEFEHGGTESAVEIDADEAGEYEAETERGGEVALEQFWLNKAFWGGKFNIKAGEIIIPVGEINAYHMPNNFFSVYRSEGEAKMLPNTWHQVGVSLWGRLKHWRYEAIFTSGLDAERFGHNCFVHYGATSPYEYKLGNVYAGAARIDNFSIPGLRLSLSGYYGYTFRNTERKSSASYNNVTGALAIGSFGFELNRWNWIVRGNATYAHLDDASAMTTFMNAFPKHTQQDGSPSKHSPIASNAYSVGLEAGYNVFSQINCLRDKQSLYLFGRYEDYNTFAAGSQKAALKYDRVKRMAFGINYSPIKQITVKGEYSKRFLPHGYNNEPSFSLGITFNGMFNTSHWFNKKPCQSNGLSEEQMERINNLTREVEELKRRQPVVIEKDGTKVVDNAYVVNFAQNESEISSADKENLDKIPSGATVDINAFSSPEGNANYNKKLSEKRANAVKEYLSGRGVKVSEVYSNGAADKYCNRIAVVTVK